MTKSYPTFQLKRSQYIESLNITVNEYRHIKTGALHYHLAAQDEENVFFVGLRTVPMDNTGVAHILEHTSLCGSQRYPVRDPFFMMIRRSLNTFMNAFTSSDWTAYPFASQNKKDFNNLLDVYLDAVFFSRLHPLDFAQEGHRLEFAKPDDPNSELQFKGVVFNEMKGAMSSPASMLWHTLCKYLYPTTTYHYNSGGDPEHIPDLTYEQLTDFYRLHYHPSNAVFMTYGDISAHEHQQRFEQQVLSKFDYLTHKIQVKTEKRYYAPLSVMEAYPVEQGETKQKTHVVLAWLLGKITDLEQLIEARLLSNVLLMDSASPLSQALETSKLGQTPSPLCGLEDSNYELAFVCGLEGSEIADAESIETLILTTLKTVAEQGVPFERLETVLHQLELSQREITGGNHPYGLQLIMLSVAGAIHYGDPITLLDLDPILLKLRTAIQNPNYIKELVKKHLLDNPHRIRLVLYPEPQLAARRENAERARLAEIKRELSPDLIQKIVEQSQSLLQRQVKEDDASILPTVTLQDIPEKKKIPLPVVREHADFPHCFYAEGTNGLVYQDVVINLPQLNDELLTLLPYYVLCVSKLGCGDQDYLAMQAWQSAVSGGVYANTLIRSDLRETNQLQGELILSGKALLRHHEKLSELLRTTLTMVRFNEFDRIRELMAQTRAQHNQSITGSGHSLAMMAASSGLHPGAALGHRLHGLVAIQSLNRLDKTLVSREVLEAFSAKLAAIHQMMVNAPKQFLLVGEASAQKEWLTELKKAWQSTLAFSPTFEAFNFSGKTATHPGEMWITPTQVNFCAKAYATVSIEHPDAAPLSVLAVFLRNGYLHRVIREQGGAYGGGASHDPDITAFRFYSYRDPRLQATLADFDAAIEWFLTTNHSLRQLEEAILMVIASIDKPSSPAGEAKKAFYHTLHGRTPEQRQLARARILKVTLADLTRVAQHYLDPQRAHTAVITNASTLAESGDLGMQVCYVD